MSTLNPKGVTVKLGGEDVEFLFTLNAIDRVQDASGQTLPEIMGEIADGRNPNSIVSTRMIVAVLANDWIERQQDPWLVAEPRTDLKPMSEATAGRLVTEANRWEIVGAILEAYGISLPAKEEGEEPDPPKRATAKKKS